MLMIIKAVMNSEMRSGLIIRLPMLCAYISSRNEIEKPSWPRNRMSHSSTAPMNSPLGAGKEAGVLADIELQEAPHQHLHGRPVDQLDQPRPRRAQQIPVAQHHGGDAPRRKRDRLAAAVIAPPPALRRGRARRRGTPPRACCGRSGRAGAAGVSSSTMRPAFMHDHALAQAFHFEHVVRGEQHGGAALGAIALEPRAHPVRRVGIERGGRLVEQQDLGLVDQGLRQRHPGLLPGRELAGRPVQEIGQVQLLGDRGDAPGDVRDAVEPAEHRQVLPDGQPLRHLDIGDSRSSCDGARDGGDAPCRCRAR